MTKEWVFSSNNHDNLDIRLNWLFSLMTRYHLAKTWRRFFAELGLGMEEFKVSASGQSIANTNGFVSRFRQLYLVPAWREAACT